MKFSSLGSGSEGNAWIFRLESGQSNTTVMVDCGFAVKETVARLARVGLQPDELDAIVVTHEHGDHLSGVFKFSRRFDTPVVLTHGTWLAALKSGHTTEDYLQSNLVRRIDSHQAFEVGLLTIQPFPVPHDAREPIQLLLSHGSFTVGLLTDCGHATPHMLHMLKHADALVLESNHCPSMLAGSAYPDSLKRRVGGQYGHLSNEVACEILATLRGHRLKYAVAAHLSKNTNCPNKVRDMWQAVLGPADIPFGIACQEKGFEWWDLMNHPVAHAN